MAQAAEIKAFRAKAQRRNKRPQRIELHWFLAGFSFPFAPLRETVF
jgi:hypothetical protein